MSAARTNRYMGATVARAGIARAVVVAGTVVALILVAGIVLTLLGANTSNDIFKAVHDAARFLAGPFRGLFSLSSPQGDPGGQLGHRGGRVVRPRPPHRAADPALTGVR